MNHEILAAFGFMSVMSCNSYPKIGRSAQEINENILRAFPVQNSAKSAREVLLQPGNILNFKNNSGAVLALTKKLDANLDYKATPSATLAPPPHYNSTGINDEGTEKFFQKDARMAYDFALGFAATGRPIYAEKAQKIIDDWAKTLKNLKTKQAEDEINFNIEYMVLAASLVKNFGNWNPQNFNNFLKNVAIPASTQANPNNHGLWGIFMEASIYAWLGDNQGLSKIRSRWIQHLENSINEEGIMENEVQRSGTNNWRGGADKGKKGLAYTHYALLPATLAAEIFAQNEMPVWNTDAGKKLGKAFAQAASWTRNPQTFPYYQSNGGNLEGVNSASYFVILNKIYPNSDAKWLLENNKISADGFHLIELFK